MVCLAATAALLIAAAPAASQGADEYIPLLPNAGGDKELGAAEGTLPTSLGGRRDRDTQRDRDSQRDRDRNGYLSGPSEDARETAIAVGSDDDGDNSSGLLGTLLDPLILLLLGGVLAITIAMLLIRRHGDGDAARGAWKPDAPPPTPDGEIVGPEG